MSFHTYDGKGGVKMKSRQRVKWKQTGEYGTVKWVTKRGTFAVEWDDGEYIEYNTNVDSLITVLE